MKILATITYDGSMYYGFQKQKDVRNTIQGIIEEKLSTIFHREIKIYGAGRTDRYVHASGQTFHFEVENLKMDLERLKYSLNKMLPDDIVIKDMKIVADDFHARLSAIGKHYQYRIVTVKNPFYLHYALTYLKKLDFNLLRQGMKLFLGRHDFYNFCSNNDDVDYFETIEKFTLRKSHDTVIFDIYGSGFKRYMVRMIIGTLLALNEHQITFDYIKERLDSSHDKVNSYNAPPQGLYLMEVSYDQK